MDILIIASLIIGAVILFLVELFRASALPVFWQELHHLCQLLCLCLYGHHGRCHYAYHICPGLYRLVGMVHALQDTRQNCIKKNITSKVDRSAEEKVKVGDIGVTTTRLALIGYAEINGDIVEVENHQTAS